MSGPKCAFNPAVALRRVFMPATLGNSSYLHVTRIFVPALIASSLYQARAASWSSPHSNRNNNGSRSVVRREQPRRVKVKLGRLPRDDEIREPYVYVIESSDQHGRPVLSGQQRTQHVLADLDLDTYSLQVVDMNLPDDQELDWPVCRVVNKREALEKAKKDKERKKTQTIKEKTLELNWALAPHDQEHKLRTMQKFLAKGNRVQVVLMKKQNGKAKATSKDAQALVDRIIQAVEEVPGSTEWKKREGALLGTLKINLQGKAQVKAKDEGKGRAEEEDADAETEEGDEQSKPEV